ncbi:MAG: radical SAM protein [Candidatus Lokiarchaeota archaeon]|nr:radical SAM protein [Candidatus Lokiarchaeota archaeon]
MLNPFIVFTGAMSLISKYLKNRITNIPLAVNYDITYKCNLNCEHCYFRSSNPKPWELSDEQWHEVFKKHHSLGISSAALTGGEPTLRMNVIRDAYETFGLIQIATNGLIKIPDDIRATIWTSIDGVEETHNKIRGAKIYKKVIENIRDDPRITISTTLSTSNYKEIEQVVENCTKIGVSGIFFMLYSGNLNDPLLLTGSKLKRTIREIYRMIDEYPDFVIYSKMMTDCMLTKKFINECIFLDNNLIVSYFPDMRKKRCVMGDWVDCRTCSCIVPIIAYSVKRIDLEILRRAEKFSLGLRKDKTPSREKIKYAST